MFNFLKRVAASIQNPAADRKILFLDDADDKLKIKDSNGDLESFTLGGGSATEDAVINGLTVGKGAGDIATNTVLGLTALNGNTTGVLNTAIGSYALLPNTTGSYNTVNGSYAMSSNTTGSDNTAVGVSALLSNTTGSGNTAIGLNALSSNTTGVDNTAVGISSMRSNTTGVGNSSLGYRSGRYITGGGSNQTSSNSVYLGYDTRASANGNTNEIVIGYTAEGLGSNTVTLGNASITNTYLRGATGINVTSVNASAQLQIDSTTKGFLPPRMTAAQASAIGSPAEGLLLYVTDTDVTFTAKGWWGYDGSAWAKLNN